MGKKRNEIVFAKVFLTEEAFQPFFIGYSLNTFPEDLGFVFHFTKK